MPKRKAITAAGAGRRAKRIKTEAFLWKPNAWKVKRVITAEVSLLVSCMDAKALLIKKLLELDPEDEEENKQLPEIATLALLPDCNRVVKPILYSHADPDPEHGTALFQHYLLGDLQQWKRQQFDSKNWRPVPESFIWRCFLQISQALAFIQGQIGPDRDKRGCMIHRDIKPKNILVVNNGTTYPSFKLHDFDCAMVYHKSTARRPSRCGTFQWQPPENTTQGINTRAADVWALGACIHFLATGKAPIEDSDAYAARIYHNNDHQHPASAQVYGHEIRYYDACVPRQAIPINLSKDQLHQRGLGLSTEEKRAQGIGPEYHQYSDELNDWMIQCLNHTPRRRPTTGRLVYGMSLEAMGMLKKIGGKSALVDMDARFGIDA